MKTELKSGYREHTATLDGNECHYWYNGVLDAVLTVKDATEAQDILDDWARLDITVEAVQRFQPISERTGVEIDFICYSEDGDIIIDCRNGAFLEYADEEVEKASLKAAKTKRT